MSMWQLLNWRFLWIGLQNIVIQPNLCSFIAQNQVHIRQLNIYVMKHCHGWFRIGWKITYYVIVMATLSIFNALNVFTRNDNQCSVYTKCWWHYTGGLQIALSKTHRINDTNCNTLTLVRTKVHVTLRSLVVFNMNARYKRISVTWDITK
jgi:hypothetical protein